MKLLLAFATLFVACNAVPSRPSGRVVGGAQAAQGQFPYIVSIQDAGVEPPVHVCAASIIDELTLVTSTSCVKNFNPGSGNLDVVAGDLTLSDVSGTEQRRTVISQTLHLGYNEDQFTDDIAIMKIAEPFVFDDAVQPVTLPASGFNTTGRCIFSGWGAEEYLGSPVDTLQFFELDIVWDQLCQDWNTVVHITEGMLCAGGVAGEDSCTKDGGGPLYCGDYQNGGGFLGGIASFGSFCATGVPSVYTEVSMYIDWIEANR